MQLLNGRYESDLYINSQRDFIDWNMSPRKEKKGNSILPRDPIFKEIDRLNKKKDARTISGPQVMH